MPDVPGTLQRGSRRLGGLVGVKCTLVVGVGARVERLTGEVDVEVLQLHAERRDVLLGEPLDRRDLGLGTRQLTPLAGLAGTHRDRHQGAEDEQHQDQFHGHSVRRSGKIRGHLQACDEQVARRPPTTYDLLGEAAVAPGPTPVESRCPRRGARLSRTGGCRHP